MGEITVIGAVTVLWLCGFVVNRRSKMQHNKVYTTYARQYVKVSAQIKSLETRVEKSWREIERLVVDPDAKLPDGETHRDEALRQFREVRKLTEELFEKSGNRVTMTAGEVASTHHELESLLKQHGYYTSGDVSSDKTD